MNRLIVSFGLFAILPLLGFSQDASPYRKVTHNAFKRGEEIKYRVHYGAINAGQAVMSISTDAKEFAGRKTIHVIGTGQSKGSFDWIFKVRDRYESYMDEEALMPWLFIRNVDEGGFKIKQNQIYDHSGLKVNSNGKSIVIPKYIQDMMSSLYYARTIDFSKAKAGDKFEVKTFVDDEVWDLKIKFLGKEAIKTDVGKVNCLKFCPVVQKGRVFKKEEDLTIYISDDANHIPIRAEGEILVGSVKMDITSYSGLANTLNLVK